MMHSKDRAKLDRDVRAGEEACVVKKAYPAAQMDVLTFEVNHSCVGGQALLEYSQVSLLYHRIDAPLAAIPAGIVRYSFQVADALTGLGPIHDLIVADSAPSTGASRGAHSRPPPQASHMYRIVYEAILDHSHDVGRQDSLLYTQFPSNKKK